MMDSGDLMSITWRDFVVFAFNEPRMISAFNKATGRHYKASGVRPSDAQLADDTAAFVLWVTREYWGMEHAPAAYRAEHEAIA